MRIGVVAPLARPVEPDSPSSIEQLVWLLTEELVARGHDVTLFASGDSRTSAALHAVYPRGYRREARLWDNWQLHELVHLGAAFELAGELDVVHSHVYHFAGPFSRLTTVPVLHTDHLPTSPDIAECYARYPEARIVAVSHYDRRKLGRVPHVAVVHNGVDVARFPFAAAGGDHLLFLGHLIPRKGAAEAIEVARKAGIRLVLAGKADPEYFEERIAPFVDGEWVTYVGPVDVSRRNELLAGAGALVFPSVAAEPFGLVMVEAMACGTPVAALERCAVPEIVENGVTGWHAPDVDALAERIPGVLELDRWRVRREAEARFGHRRMVDDYEALYAEAP